MSLLGYRITVTGGTSQAAGGEVSSNTARVTVNTTPGPFSVSYSAHCGQEETGQSPTATATSTLMRSFGDDHAWPSPGLL